VTKKGKEVATKKQSKRFAKERTFISRSPYLRDYREAKKKLKP